MSLRFTLPSDLVSQLNSFTGQAGIARPPFILELVSDFLSIGLLESTESVVKQMKSFPVTDGSPKVKQKRIELDHIPTEAEERLHGWVRDMDTTLSTLMEVIIRNQFSDRQKLQAIVDRVRAKGYQAELTIPGVDTSENVRTGVVARLSPQLRSEIERVEKVESRTTTQQIEYFLSEAVEHQEEFDQPLLNPPQRGSERKLVRVSPQVHAKLVTWSKRKNRTLQNQIAHILHKAIEKHSTGGVNTNSPAT